MVQNFDPFPLFLFTRLRYTDRKSITGASGWWTHEWRANSMFDIDYTAVGRQPMGYDQLSAIYHKYRVYGLSYHFTLINEGSEPIQLTMYTDTVTGVSIDSNDASEKKNARTLFVGSSGGKQMGVMKGYINIKKAMGYKTNTDEDLASGVSGNPLKTLFMNIGAYTADGIATTMAATLIVRFKFYSKFFDIQQIGAS